MPFNLCIIAALNFLVFKTGLLMIYLLLSIACSTGIMLLFKTFSKYGISTFQAIVINYWVCVISGLFLLPDISVFFNSYQQVWFPYAILLGLAFISSFNLIAVATQKSGITVTTIATRTSMVLPVMAAFYLYGDSITTTKILGIVLAIVAVFLTAIKSEKVKTEKNAAQIFFLLLPFIVFFIAGGIEILFNYTQIYFLKDANKDVAPFLIYAFGFAGLVGSFIVGYDLFKNKKQIITKDVLAGIILGVPNYFSAFFFVLALSHSGFESSVVIPLNNIGVVIASALGAWYVFKEKLSTINLVGLFCAVVAILLITL